MRQSLMEFAVDFHVSPQRREDARFWILLQKCVPRRMLCQFFQNEPEVAADEAELVVDSVEPLIDHLEPRVDGDKLGVNRDKPGILGLEGWSMASKRLSCAVKRRRTSEKRRSISSACSRKCSSRVLPAIDCSRRATRCSSDLSVMPRNTARSMPRRLRCLAASARLALTRDIPASGGGTTVASSPNKKQ